MTALNMVFVNWSISTREVDTLVELALKLKISRKIKIHASECQSLRLIERGGPTTVKARNAIKRTSELLCATLAVAASSAISFSN